MATGGDKWWKPDVSERGRHERAVARRLGFAREPAVSGDRRDALGWQQVVGCSMDDYRRGGSRPALAGLIAGDLLNRAPGRRSLLRRRLQRGPDD